MKKELPQQLANTLKSKENYHEKKFIFNYCTVTNSFYLCL